MRIELDTKPTVVQAAVLDSLEAMDKVAEQWVQAHREHFRRNRADIVRRLEETFQSQPNER